MMTKKPSEKKPPPPASGTATAPPQFSNNKQQPLDNAVADLERRLADLTVPEQQPVLGSASLSEANVASPPPAVAVTPAASAASGSASGSKNALLVSAVQYNTFYSFVDSISLKAFFTHSNI